MCYVFSAGRKRDGSERTNPKYHYFTVRAHSWWFCYRFVSSWLWSTLFSLLSWIQWSTVWGTKIWEIPSDDSEQVCVCFSYERHQHGVLTGNLTCHWFKKDDFSFLNSWLTQLNSKHPLNIFNETLLTSLLFDDCWNMKHAHTSFVFTIYTSHVCKLCDVCSTDSRCRIKVNISNMMLKDWWPVTARTGPTLLRPLRGQVVKIMDGWTVKETETFNWKGKLPYNNSHENQSNRQRQ